MGISWRQVSRTPSLFVEQVVVMYRYLLSKRRPWGWSPVAIYADAADAQKVADSWGTDEEWKPIGKVTELRYHEKGE